MSAHVRWAEQPRAMLRTVARERALTKARDFSRDDVAVFLLDTFGTPTDAADSLVIRAEAKLRGLAYVRPHFRAWPKRRKPS